MDMKCVQQYCSTEYTACTKSAQCMEVVGCVDKCWKAWDTDPTPQKFTVQNCTTKCAYSYADAAFMAVLTCMATNKCVTLPATPNMCKGPHNVKIQKNISLADMAGTWWTLRGHNPVYDCYPCQKTTLTSTIITWSFHRYTTNQDWKRVHLNVGVTSLPCLKRVSGNNSRE